MNNQTPHKADQPFSILLIGTQMALAGAQKGLLDQAHWFKSHGHDVMVAFFYDKENLHEKWKGTVDFPILNFHAYQPGAGMLRQSLFLIRGVWRLWKLLRRRKFDVVETFTHDSNLLALPFAWLAGVPVRIATHRGEIENFPLWREKLHSWIINIGIADMLIAVSEQTRQKGIAEGVKPEKVIAIPNGVTPFDTASIDRIQARKQLGLAGDNIFLLAVGRLTYQKGHEFFVQAMPKILNRYPNVKAALCGDGPLYPQLENQIRKLGLVEHVRLLGVQSNVAPLLVASDVFVLPSRSEGLSRALMEAMAAGVPVVATRVNGIKDLITDKVHGLLVFPEDADALADSILQLLDNPQMMTDLKLAARAHVLHFHSTDGMCKKYAELMQALLTTHG